MKLLPDVHHSSAAAVRLQALGHDVVAASSDPALSCLDDDGLLQAATAAGRVLVSENARDFDRIVRAWAAVRRHHEGVIFTSPRRFHRGGAAYPANLISALTKVLEDPPKTTLDWIHWLEEPHTFTAYLRVHGHGCGCGCGCGCGKRDLYRNFP